MSTHSEPATVFYDGTCGFCHGAVQFLLRQDPHGARFRYAPLQGETAKAVLQPVEELPDSIVVKVADGGLLTESRAAQYIAHALGGVWRFPAWMSAVVPRFVLDGLYRMVARSRHRLFGRKSDLCPLLPPEQREFFLP